MVSLWGRICSRLHFVNFCVFLSFKEEMMLRLQRKGRIMKMDFYQNHNEDVPVNIEKRTCEDLKIYPDHQQIIKKSKILLFHKIC